MNRRSSLLATLLLVAGSPVMGQQIAKDDYVIIKPKHSGFYSTPLDTLLTYLGARHLIITGLTTERCLLFTANDAFLRDFALSCPADCTAAIDEADHAAAIRILERVLGANVADSEQLDFTSLLKSHPGG